MLLRRSRTLGLLATGCALLSLVTACGGSGESGGAGSESGGDDPGTVKVLYAGSLVHVMEDDMGPRFADATGATYQGYGAGSTKVAHEISGKVRAGDVFISANPEVNKELMGRRNGDWVTWYAEFASSPLVIGYNPKSDFATALKSKPWYQVVTEAGFRLGRTDPKLDPKGELAAEAITKVGKAEGDPGLSKQILAHSQVFPEQDLVGRLQSGQLDAAFFYSIETNELSIPTVSLDPIDLGAHYTVTVLNHAPNPEGGRAFVSFLLGSKGQAILNKHGFTVADPPTVSGDSGAVPGSLKSALGLP